MARTIRFAGINQRLRRQLVQTANLLHSSYNKCFIAEWDDGPCEVLVADATTATGYNAMTAAGERGITVVTIAWRGASANALSVPPDPSTATLTRVIRKALAERGVAPAA